MTTDLEELGDLLDKFGIAYETGEAFQIICGNPPHMHASPFHHLGLVSSTKKELRYEDGILIILNDFVTSDDDCYFAFDCSGKFIEIGRQADKLKRSPITWKKQQV